MVLRVLLLLLCHTSIDLCEKPLIETIKNYFVPKNSSEKIYEKIVDIVTNLINLDVRKKENEIVFEKFYTAFYLFPVGHMAAAGNSKKSQTLITLQTKLLTKTFNSLGAILESPLQLNQRKKNPAYQTLYDLLPLAVGPGPTLLDILLEQWNEVGYEREKNILAERYSSFIDCMYLQQYSSGVSGNAKSLLINLHYGQQAYKIMGKNKLTLTMNPTVNANTLNTWLHLPQSEYTEQFIENLRDYITEKLPNLIKHIQKYKIVEEKKDESDYTYFIEDIDFHATVVSTLYFILYLHKEYELNLPNLSQKYIVLNKEYDLNFTQQLQEYIETINTFLNSIKDSATVDLLPEALFFRQYRNFLIETIRTMINTYSPNLNKYFNTILQKIDFIFDERIDNLKQYVQDFASKNNVLTNLYTNIITTAYEQKEPSNTELLLIQSKNKPPFISLSSDLDHQKLINQIKKTNNHIASAKWHWRIWGLLKSKKLLDLIQDDGVAKIAKALIDANELLASIPLSNTVAATPFYVPLQKEAQQLITHLYELQNSIYSYLKNVLYIEIPNPLYKAYIDTGKILITTIQKIIKTAEEKFQFLQLKKLEHKIFDFTQLDKIYMKKAIFL